MNNPLNVDLGQDSEVIAYVRFAHGRDGVRWKAKQAGEEKEVWGEIKEPPTLSSEQLVEADRICKAIKEATQHLNHENIHAYLKANMWLVLGDYCGGTKFATGFLNRMGISAAHETVFTIEGNIAGIAMIGCQNRVEVSGAAALWMPMFPGLNTIWLVRHPVDLINSQYHYKGRTDGTTTDLQRDLLCRWNQIMDTNPRQIWRVESNADQRHVLEELGIPWTSIKPSDLSRARGAPRNSKQRSSKETPMTWEKLCPALRELAEGLHYTPKGLREVV